MAKTLQQQKNIKTNMTKNHILTRTHIEEKNTHIHTLDQITHTLNT